MKNLEQKNNTNFETINEMLNNKYGEIGTKERELFNRESILFMISELIKDERKKQKLTQEQLAKKIGTKKQYISRVENGKLDIQVTTLISIVEQGLGKHLNFILT